MESFLSKYSKVTTSSLDEYSEAGFWEEQYTQDARVYTFLVQIFAIQIYLPAEGFTRPVLNCPC